MVDRYIIV
jgi:serine/threonine-protein kinase SRPK3